MLHLYSKVLDFLEDNDMHATFFVVGSRVVSFPNTLVTEYMMGNEISVHTWSHHVRPSKLIDETLLTCVFDTLRLLRP